MRSDLPTTIFVPSSTMSEDDNVFPVDEESLCLDDDDLSLSQEIARELRRTAPESRRPPPRTISASSDSPRMSYTHCSAASGPKVRRTPCRTVSNDSLRRTSRRMSSLSPRHVSSLSVPSEVSLDVPSSADPLEQKYREGLKKLAASMRHSDMTRSAIKRHCKFSYRTSASPALSRQQDFFLSSRCDELEDCRRQLLQMMIHQNP